MTNLDVEFDGYLRLHGETWSTPAICRVSSRVLIIAADRAGFISAFDAVSRTLIWQQRLGSVITASPIVVDEANGDQKVLIGTHDHEFFALKAEDGSVCWRYSTPGPVRATAAAADIDDDGALEIVVASYGPQVSVLSLAGNVRWSRRRPKHVLVRGTKLGIVAAPLVYDVDRDGYREIVVAGRSPWIICYDRRGQYKWYRKVRYDSDSPPSFAVVNGTPLVLIGGGEHTSGRGDNALIALDGRSGREAWRTELGGAVDSAATVSRLPSGKQVAFCGTLASAKVVAVDLATGREIWSRRFGPTTLCDHSHRDSAQPAHDQQCRRSATAEYFTEYAHCRSYTTPLVTDLDGDGRHEVVAGSNNGTLCVLDAETGETRYEVQTGGIVRGSFVLDDIDDDGRAELCVPSGDCIRIYRVPANPGAVRFFKGRTDMLGADHEAITEPVTAQKTSGWLPARLWWDLQARDFMRWCLVKLDSRVLRKFGVTLFDYYY